MTIVILTRSLLVVVTALVTAGTLARRLVGAGGGALVVGGARAGALVIGRGTLARGLVIGR